MPKAALRRRDDACCSRSSGQQWRRLRRSRRLTTILIGLLLREAIALDEVTRVTAPAAGLTAGASYAIGWDFLTDADARGTTGDLHPFEIELRSCASEPCGCGNPYIQLCPSRAGTAEAAGYCMDSDGSYDVIIPQDMPAGRYVFSVTYAGAAGWSSASSSATDAEYTRACSMSFLVKEPTRAVALSASAPAEQLQPGDSFTARWEYNDGTGQTGSGGNFEVNLYSCEDGACANGSCGTFVSALCGSAGCYDPGQGDYDVRLPATAAAGTFKLQVKRATSSSIGGGGGSSAAQTCSSAFQVQQRDTFDDASFTPSPVASPPPDAEGGGGGAGNRSSPAPTAQPAASPTRQPVAAQTPAPSPTGGSTTSSSDGDGNTPGTPPTGVPPRVTCNPNTAVKYSFSRDGSSMLPLVTLSHENENRDAGGCSNFSKLFEWLKSGPNGVPKDLLYIADPETGVADISGIPTPTGAWLLRTSIDVTNGVMFEVMGSTNPGGDTDKIFMSSSPMALRIRGAGGHLYFYGTEVTSWVEERGEPHILPLDSDGTEPRSYIGCLSEMTEPGQVCEGRAQNDRGECRMDIIKSTIAHLGYDASESYGISWKARGLCEDLSNVETLFDRVRVYGDIIDSDIYGNWYGHYSYGHLGGVWINNLMHDNIIYGFDPHDDSDYLTISGNTCYNNGNHGIIASKRCDHLLIEDNESYDNGGSGLMLHQSCDDSIVRGNTFRNNFDAGISIVETSRTKITGNTMSDNKYGIRVIVGSKDNLIARNEIDGNAQNDIYLYFGSDLDVITVPGNTGINSRNKFDTNSITSSTKYTMDVEDSDETEVVNNTWLGTGGFSFTRSTKTRLSGNTGPPSKATPNVVESCFTPDSGISPQC